MSSRPLTAIEYDQVKANTPSLRDKLLVIIGYRTGYRISEILSLKIRDVLLPSIKVSRRNMKGKIESREVLKHKELDDAIKLYLNSLDRYNLESPLFWSRKNRDKPLTRFMGYKILKQAYKNAGLTGNGLSCHTLRKSFTKNIYTKSNNNIILTQKAMCHKNIATTVKYLNVFQDEIDSLVLD